jgi:transposase InsO family protein
LAHHLSVPIDFSRRGKPTDSAFIETVNGTLRDECLNLHWFGNLAQAAALNRGLAPRLQRESFLTRLSTPAARGVFTQSGTAATSRGSAPHKLISEG